MQFPQTSKNTRYELVECYSGESFSQMVKKYRAKYDLRAPALAEGILGIREDIFRGKCNGNRPSTRDFIIAVCAVLLMNSCEVDEALRSHKRMYAGFDEFNDRDNCIIDFLDQQAVRWRGPSPEIISALNKALTDRNFPRIGYHRPSGEKRQQGKKVSSEYSL